MGNYNLKNILLGVGIGLVFSSTMNISMGNRELTLEEVKNEARKHGLVVYSTADPFIYEDKIRIEIKNDMKPEGIAELLKQKGIIDDTGAFLNKLKEAGKETKLQEGIYEITKGSDYDEIINILTQ